MHINVNYISIKGFRILNCLSPGSLLFHYRCSRSKWGKSKKLTLFILLGKIQQIKNIALLHLQSENKESLFHLFNVTSANLISILSYLLQLCYCRYITAMFFISLYIANNKPLLKII